MKGIPPDSGFLPPFLFDDPGPAIGKYSKKLVAADDDSRNRQRREEGRSFSSTLLLCSYGNL